MFSRLLEWEYIRNRQLVAARVEGIIPIFVVNVLGMVGEHGIFFEIAAGQHRDETPPASHVLGRCGRKMRTLKIYSPGTRKCGYFYLIHCIHASAVD
jgi:hypothetical protein